MPKTMTIDELKEALAAREKQLSKLHAQRERIAKQLAALDGRIAALGGGRVKAKRKGRRKAARKIAAKRAKRTKGGPSLTDVLAKVLVGKGNVKVAEAAKLALAAGYKSKSAQFGNVASQALGSDKRFKKVARGVYTLKGKAGAAAAKPAGKARKKARKKAMAKPAKAAAKPARAAGKSLVEYIQDVLAKAAGGMRVKDIMAAVKAAGYKSGAKDFYNLVAAAARGDDFEKVSRGVYVLKGGKKPAPAKKAKKGGKKAKKGGKKTG